MTKQEVLAAIAQKQIEIEALQAQLVEIEQTEKQEDLKKENQVLLSPTLKKMFDNMASVSDICKIAKENKLRLLKNKEGEITLTSTSPHASCCFRYQMSALFPETEMKEKVSKAGKIMFTVTSRDKRLSANPDIATLYKA